jgi:DNA-binding response OmpR family regulator
VSKLRVLIVEDEPVIAMTAEDMLGELGYLCSVCASLEEGLKAAETDQFDFALLDVNLNGAESFPIAERLRKRGTPFFFTTGYGTALCKARFGDAAVVIKPYQISDLEAAIAATLSRA